MVSTIANLHKEPSGLICGKLVHLIAAHLDDRESCYSNGSRHFHSSLIKHILCATMVSASCNLCPIAIQRSVSHGYLGWVAAMRLIFKAVVNIMTSNIGLYDHRCCGRFQSFRCPAICCSTSFSRSRLPMRSSWWPVRHVTTPTRPLRLQTKPVALAQVIAVNLKIHV